MRDVADDSFWAKRPDSGKKSEKFYKNSDEEGSEGSDFYSSISGSEESGSEDSESDSEGIHTCRTDHLKQDIFKPFISLLIGHFVLLYKYSICIPSNNYNLYRLFALVLF